MFAYSRPAENKLPSPDPGMILMRCGLFCRAAVTLTIVRGFIGVAEAGPISPNDGKWTVPLGPSRDPHGPFATVRLPRTSFKGEQARGAALSLPAHRAA